MSLTVFIPTAGIGSRLEDFTKNYNKSLLPFQNKPLISHLIDKFTSSTEFVIALGHKGNLVKQYLSICYPQKKIKYVKIDNYNRKGSGLGYTLYRSKKFLQKPFLFCPCDGLFEKININKNINNIFFKTKLNNGNYRYIELNKKKISIKEKKKTKEKVKLYTGISFIKDFKKFWKYADIKDKSFVTIGESFPINKMIKDGSKFKINRIDWDDFGNIKEYEKKNKNLRILHKSNETIYFVNKKVIKFNTDINFIKDRVKRGKRLLPFVPIIDSSTNNFYSYKMVSGKVFSDCINEINFKKLLIFCKDFWSIKKLSPIQSKKFQKECFSFYKTKTEKRLSKYLKKNKNFDNFKKINFQKVEKVKVLLKKISWNKICNGTCSRFHGDLHFENILKTKKGFKFLDWRQNFNNEKIYGDIYYDLAKIMHGIYVSHKEVHENNFKVLTKQNKVRIFIKRNKKLKIIEKLFKNWIEKNGYDLKKVMILTGLIFLNISPLHHYPYNNFLFLLGKKMLSENL